MFRFIFLVFFSSFISAFASQDTTTSYQYNHLFTPKALNQDFEYLIQQLKKAHPALYWYTTAQEFELFCQGIRSRITTPSNEFDFLRKIALLNAKIKCVHSDIRPSHQGQEWLNIRKNLIPINILKSGNRFYVSENRSEDGIPGFGTEIISINRQPVQEIITSLLPYIPADGDNETRKYYALSRAFNKYFAIYSLPLAKSFLVEYVNQEGKIDTIRLQAISKSDFLNKRKANKQKTSAPVSFEQIHEKKAAILRIPTFRHDLMDKAGINFKEYLKQVFKTLDNDNTQFLIVDLRNNGGGYSEYGAQLCSFLVPSDFTYCRKMTLNTNQLLPEITYDIPETFEGFPEGIQSKNGEFTWPYHSVLGVREVNKYRFRGKVFILINGGCVSTTSEVVSILKFHKTGQFIGEEVGGSYRGDSGGVLGWITLPNTRIRVRMAMVKYILGLEENITAKKGVVPDFSVSPTIDDLKSGRDPVLEFALSKIE